MKKLTAFLTLLPILLFVMPVQVLAAGATLSLSPSSGTFNQGCNFSLNVNLDTAGAQTDGTDAILVYDTSKLTAISISAGTIYPDYPGNNIDPSGKITISGLASVTSPFQGQGTLATINFTVKEDVTGATQISFEFDPKDKAKTTDSNVVQRGTVADILNSVVNGSYTIGTASCGVTSGSTSSGVTVLPNTGGQGATVATPPAQPKTIDQIVDKTGKGPGTPELTSTLVIIGSILAVLGVLGLVIL